MTPSDVQVAEFASVIAGFHAVAAVDMRAALAGLDPADAVAWRDEALVVVPDLVTTYGDAVVTHAADMYDEWRDEARVGGRFRAKPGELAEFDQIAAGVRAASGSLFQSAPDVEATLTRLEGSLSRYLTSGVGDTITGNTARDPKAAGWRRIAKGSACRFCRMLAGRGAVYRERTVRFKAHDHCQCSAAPSWDWDAAEPIDVAYRASKKTITDADRARVRDYLSSMV